MRRPRILITPWRQELATFFDPKTDLITISPTYPDAVCRVGGTPILAPHVDTDRVDELLDVADALLISGGQDMDPGLYGATNTSSWKVRPAYDAFDLAITRAALARNLPILGVCRGIQVVNVALGGDLRQEIQLTGSPHHPTYGEVDDIRERRHLVDIAQRSRLASIHGAGPLSVNSLHHQAVGRVADSLRVVATAPDGVIEAVEGTAADVLAVQWHPEMIPEEGGDLLFADLVDRAGSRTRVGA